MGRDKFLDVFDAHAVRKIEGLCKSDVGLKDDIDLLTRMLLD
jgi:hypothetical protein